MQFNRSSYWWTRGAKRMAALSPIWIVALSGHLWAGTISLQINSLGGNVFQYQFAPAGFDLLKNQEIDIRFDPAEFSSLFSGSAGNDFHLTLLQPNNPVGAFGDYSILATTDHASLAGIFSVEVIALQSVPPAELPFLVHQFDSGGQRILGSIDSGEVGAAAVPEPGGWLLSGTALALSGILRVLRRRS